MALRTMNSATFIALVVLCLPMAAAQPQSLDWTLHMKSRSAARAVTVDQMGNVVATGCAFSPDPSDWDARTDTDWPYDLEQCSEIFITKMSAGGEEVWTYEKKSLGFDQPLAVTVNDLGDIFIAGYTTGSFTDSSKEITPDRDDLFLMCILANGTHSWTYQAGITKSQVTTAGSMAIALGEAGHVFIAGLFVGASGFPGSTGSGDSFVIKLHADGAWAWTTLHSSEYQAIATDLHGNIYIAGSQQGRPGDLSPRPVVSKLLSNGALNSTIIIDSTESRGMQDVRGIAVDKAGDVFIVGHVFSGPPKVVKMYANGTPAWFTEAGTGELGNGITVDCEGNAYFFSNKYEGLVESGSQVVKVQANGDLGWTFNMSNVRWSNSMVMDEQGDMFIAGDGPHIPIIGQVSKFKTNSGCNLMEESSASRGAEAQWLAAVATVVLAMVVNPFHTQEEMGQL